MSRKWRKYQVEVNILKGKLEEKDKILRFQDSTKILDDIVSSQRSPTIRTGLGFHESVEGESNSQGEARNSNGKYGMFNKEIIINHYNKKSHPQSSINMIWITTM